MEALIEAGAENGHDVLVVQERGGLRLELEPLPLARVERGGRGQDLERDAPAQRKLKGLINHAHPTAADLTEDPEFTKPGRRHRIGGGTELRIGITDQAGSRLDQLEPVDPGGQGTGDRRVLRQEYRPGPVAARSSSRAGTLRERRRPVGRPKWNRSRLMRPTWRRSRVPRCEWSSIRPRSDGPAVQSKPP